MNKELALDFEPVETICENEKDAAHLTAGNGFRLSPEILSKYTGTYEFAPGRQATITLLEGFLVVQEGANGIKRELVPQTETSFIFRNDGDWIEFAKDGQGAITQLVLHTGNDQKKAVRRSAP